jgi:regulation of enolase protein 1 (concanavalin A-like superfamily)
VTSVDATHATAPAGIMARASLASSSINAIMRTDASYRFRFGYRTTTGGTTAASGANVGTAGNTYLRLTRVGNVFTGWESSNGVNWTQTGSITLNVGSTMFVGLAAASKNTSATTTARFREYTEVGSTPTAPNAPSGLTAGSMASDQVNLMWNDNSTNEVAFRIERKVGSGSFATLTTVAANQTSFVDSTVSAGETYTYRVIAVGAAMDSAPSNEATITVAQQDPYTNVDINSVPAGARTPLVSGVDYDITGGGADVWGTSDSFNFSYRQITGDFDIAVRVTGVQATHATAMAGLMARASLDANSRNIFMRTDASQRFRFAYRSSTGGTTTAVGSDTGTAGNTWVRLQRVGNVFTGYQSSDGVNWTVTGTITMSLPSTLLVGMAVCSKNTSVATVANFRSLSLIQ